MCGAGIAELDLYAVVTKKCGAAYTLCPAGCSQQDPEHGDCYQIPHNVRVRVVSIQKVCKKDG